MRPNDAICDLIDSFNILDAAIAEGRVSVEREGSPSPQHTAGGDDFGTPGEEGAEEEFIDEDVADNFIYKFLQSRLKPYVDGIEPFAKPKALSDKQLKQRQKALVRELDAKQSRASQMKEETDRRRQENLRRAAEEHKKKVANIRRSRFMEELERQEKSRALAKGNRDEQLFKRLFQSSVKSEREMLREEQRQREGQLRKQAVDKRVKQGAVKKYWQDQAEMLEEKIQTERRERREAEHSHRIAMDRMERETEMQLMEKMRRDHDKKWQKKETDEIKRFDAEEISSKLLRTLSHQARPKTARARLSSSK